MLQWLIKEDPRAGVVEFEEVYVSDEYRNRGIGSHMVEFAIKDVTKQFKYIGIAPRKIFIFVSKNNADARRLYEKHGFKCISEAGNLFSEDKIELIYALNLRK